MKLFFLALAMLSFFTNLARCAWGLRTCEWCQPTDIHGQHPASWRPYLTCYMCDDGRRGMWTPPPLDYNQYFGNHFGVLAPKMGGFMKTCLDPSSYNYTKQRPEEWTLGAMCNVGDGTNNWNATRITIDDWVTNKNGKLVWDW
ncbi:hypothetical protein QBC34DRAFT_374225 [Podospora aff. communis PSN243]|uniref:Cyanovirin-N domain-containing protein n=1 Tax=Podospora aff. communis PSN243 TaxID=3040156 RepID=A0AAV9H694_9PEZI|nr:hypothetical protein QBC34DRAFT_374225 [Podospora aff. communis PSN243]